MPIKAKIHKIELNVYGYCQLSVKQVYERGCQGNCINRPDSNTKVCIFFDLEKSKPVNDG